MPKITGSILRLRGFTQKLVTEGLLDEKTAKTSLAKAVEDNIPFIIFLIQNKIATSLPIAIAASDYFGIPLIDLDAFDLEKIPRDKVDSKIFQQHVLPLYIQEERLYVAVADPTTSVLHNLKFLTGLSIVPILAETNKLIRVNEQILHKEMFKGLDTSMGPELEKLEVSAELREEDETSADITASQKEDAPVVRFVNKTLLEAIQRGASDIHFEPFHRFYRIRYRIDGILYEAANITTLLAAQITARLKVMANLDTSERRLPQDGRFKINLGKTHIDFRMSTCPVSAGEKVVIRILDQSFLNMKIDDLGFEPFQRKVFLDVIQLSQGMILVTGPTGSGKTVTLYSALNILNTMEKNISTIEDPLEIYLEGINQVNVNPKTGLTFATALRAFLRQDPDIIMVGEMRDTETSEIAIKAAQTGHLVLSTLHTNSAPESVNRLLDMGIPHFNVATSVTLIIAQRLARRLCPHCKERVKIPKESLLEEGFKEEDLDSLELFEAKGCDKCINGFKGRIGIYEILRFSKAMREVILRKGSALDVEEQALKEGMVNLKMAGLNIVRKGITSLKEISRVITR